jgi:hypothetical protein
VDVEDAPRTPRTRASVAYGITALLYVVGFLPSTASALHALAAPPTVTTAEGWAVLTTVTAQVSMDVGVTVLALLLAGRQGFGLRELGLRWPSSRRARRADVDLVALTLASGFAASWVAAGLGASGTAYGWFHNPIPLLVASLLAGPAEEIALLAVPVVLLRSAGQSFGRIAALILVLRVSYHLYYGRATPGVAVWVIVVLIAFWRTGRALPLVLAHSGWDLLAVVLRYGAPPATRALVMGLLLMVLVVMGLAYVHRLRRRPETTDVGS